MKAENYFASKMSESGLNFSFEDEWFDFMVNNHKVEVKSCQPSVKQGYGFRAGRFDFTKKSSREKQFNENIWICLILNHEEEFMILGFVRARDLNKKRYIALSNIRKLNLLSLREWIGEIND